MIKAIIGCLTMFSVMITSRMQDYVDRANAIYGQIDPMYATRYQSKPDRPFTSKRLGKSLILLVSSHLNSLKTLTLLNEYEGKLSIDEIKEQYELFENQAVDSPAFTETRRLIDDASVYLDEAVMTLAVELALGDLSSFIDQSLQDVGTFLEDLQADVLGY